MAAVPAAERMGEEVELRNCPECGKAFVYVTSRLCPRCREREEQDYRQLRDFLHEQKGATLAETHAATGVAMERILRFLREGRLVETGVQWKALTCTGCGESIGSGRYCRQCQQDLAAELQRPGRDRAPDATPGRGRFYTVDRLSERDD